MSTQPHSERKHALLSPSKAAQWAVCTASVGAIEQDITDGKLPAFQPSSKAADEGTLAHEVAEWYLRDCKGGCPQGATDEMHRHGEAYADFCMSLPHDVTHEVEAGVDLWYDEYEKHQGHVDFLSIDTNEVNVVDYKFGRGVIVPAKENYQMAIYAWGAIVGYKKTHRDWKPKDSTKVRLTIYQPRTRRNEDETPHTTWDTTIDSLRLFVSSKIEHAAEIVLNPKMAHLRKFVANSKACRWCPRSAYCEAHTEYLLSGTEVVQRVQQNQKLTNPSDLSDELLRDIISRKSDIVGWLESITEYAEQRIELGNKIPGTKMVEGKGSRSWQNEHSPAFLNMVKSCGVNPYTDVEVRSPKQIEDDLKVLVRKKLLAKTNAEAVMGCVARRPGAPTLVLDTDPRPELGYNVANELPQRVSALDLI